jgi:hypothetical protein
MAWSYRSDRSDEVYASTGGPAAVTSDKLPRPPAEGEPTAEVLNPKESKTKDEAPKDPEAPPEQYQAKNTQEAQAKLALEQVERDQAALKAQNEVQAQQEPEQEKKAKK